MYEDIIQSTGCQCAVIVAHPDDEVLWAGGTILMHPGNDWTIVTACRKSDPDRSPRFSEVVSILNAAGQMGDVDDGPDQIPLDRDELETDLLSLLPVKTYDLVMTHSPQGEYTRHRRHEEVADAVISLIESKRLKARQLWLFAYTDNSRTHFPRAIDDADQTVLLPEDIWEKKYELMADVYGFSPDSWEAQTTPMCEAFWCFDAGAGIQEQIHERRLVR